MKRKTAISAVALAALTLSWPAVADETAASDRMIADFNSGQKPGNIGGDFGAWIKDPTDPMQGAIDSFDHDNRYGSKGFALRLIYSVQSNRPAFGGLWFKLGGLDASSYSGLAIRVKGDRAMGFSSTFKLEIKDELGQTSQYLVNGVTDQWQDIVVPFDQFTGMANRHGLAELVVILEDRTASARQGVLYFDDVRLTGAPN
ncbi:MAG: hypothetical protein ACKOOL_13160 [Novosphingobium sp.]